MCMYMCLVCESVHVPSEAKRGYKIPRVRGDDESSDGPWELKSGPLEEH